MRGKIVNLCIGLMNIVFGILILIYTIYIPQDIAEFTIQELSVKKFITISINIILFLILIIDISQYINNRDNGKIKTSYLYGILVISFIFIKQPITAIFPIISGINIIIHTIKDNSVEIDSTTGISIAGLIIVSMIIVIGVCLFYKNLGQYIKNKENKNNKAYEKDYFKYITELDIQDVYINVKKDNKYGYINSNGDVVIDFIYDYASPFINILSYNKEFQVALVCKDGISSIIMKNQREVMSYCSESSNENYEAKIEELSNIYSNTLGQGGKMQFEIEKKEDNINRIPSYSEPSTDYTYRYDYNDEYDIIITESNLGLGNKYELAKKDNIDIRIALECDNIDYDENYVYLYSNGTIPYYDISSKEQGWFSSYGKKNTMTGKAQILEFIDDKILLKNYNDNTIYFIDSNGEMISDIYKDIYIANDVYILKNKNNKYIVTDKELNKKFEEEFDVIDPYLVDYGLYICANTNEVIDFNDYSFAKMNWKLLNSNGETILDGIEQIYENFYKISTNKDITYVKRYEEVLEDMKDIKYNFVGDKFYSIYVY